MADELFVTRRLGIKEDFQPEYITTAKGIEYPIIAGGADGIYYRDRRLPHLVADQTGVTVATTQKTLFPVGAISPTILPANYWTVGKTVKLTCNFKWTAVANTNAVTFGMSYGAADAPACVVLSTAVAGVSSTTLWSVFMEGYATCRSTGTTGTLSLWGIALPPVGLIGATAGNVCTFPVAGVTVVSTVDTTVGTNAVMFSAQRATTAGDTVVATDIIFESIN